MKKEITLESETQSKLITDIVEKALAGITKREIIELKKICEQDRLQYYNKLKLKYIVSLGLLGLEYEITKQVEERIFFFIHDIIHQISVIGKDIDSELEIEIL